MKALFHPAEDPRRLDPARGEGLASFVVRLAARRALVGSAIAHVVQQRYGVDVKAVIDGSACHSVAMTERVSEDLLMTATWMRDPDAKRYRLGQHSLRASQIDNGQFKFCPRCAECSAQTRAYACAPVQPFTSGSLRVPVQGMPIPCWSVIKPVRYCPTHRIPLVCVERDGIFASLPEFYEISSSSGGEVPNGDVKPEIFIVQRLGFGDVISQYPVLTSRYVEKVPLETLLTIALGLGRMLFGRGDTVQSTRLGLAQLLADDLGPVFDQLTLNSFHREKKWPTPRMVFGRFLDVCADLKESGLATVFVTALEEYCYDNLCVSTRVGALFEDFRERRRWRSPAFLASDFDLPSGAAERIAPLVIGQFDRQGPIIQGILLEGGLIDQCFAARLAKLIDSRLSERRMAAVLGLPSGEFQRLVRFGIARPIVLNEKGGSEAQCFWVSELFDKRLREFFPVNLPDMPCVPEDHSLFLALGGSDRKRRKLLHQAVAERCLVPVGYLSPTPGKEHFLLRAIFSRRACLDLLWSQNGVERRDARRTSMASFIGYDEVALELMCSCEDIRTMEAHGFLLPSYRHSQPRKRVPIYTAEDVMAFRAKFIHIDEICGRVLRPRQEVEQILAHSRHRRSHDGSAIELPFLPRATSEALLGL